MVLCGLYDLLVGVCGLVWITPPTGRGYFVQFGLQNLLVWGMWSTQSTGRGYFVLFGLHNLPVGGIWSTQTICCGDCHVMRL